MIIYLHGFNSDISKKRIKWLKQIDPFVIAPSIEYHDPNILEKLSKIVEIATAEVDNRNDLENKDEFDGEQLVIIGKSLGGTVAYTLARKYGILPILINPSVEPDVTLAKYDNKIIENFKNGKKYHTGNLIEKLKKLRPNIVMLGSVLLDKGDDILDYKVAEKAFKEWHSVRTFEGGSHSFEHWKELKEVIKRALTGHWKLSCFILDDD